jgi:hypothetical protein
MSPKQIIFSVLFAGSVVKSCRTVLMNVPVYQDVLSHWEKEELGAPMHIAA